MYRYLEHDEQPPAPDDLNSVVDNDILAALMTNVDAVQQHSHRDGGGHVYVGQAGAALMLFKIAELNIPELSSSRLLRNADRYLLAALSHKPGSALSPAKCAFIETDIGTATLVLYRALQTSVADPQAWNQHWRNCADVIRTVVHQAGADKSTSVSTPSVGDDGDCEILYGRAGLLYTLLFLRSSIASDHAVGASPEILSTISELVSDSNIQRLVDAIIVRGKTGSAFYRSESSPTESIPALMWSWHGKRYLGAAHGVAGILHVLLLCPINIITPHVPSILHTVEWLLSLQDAEGNWPSSVPFRPGRQNELIHWCHGAPGMLILLSTLLRRLPPSTTNPSPSETSISPALHQKINASITHAASLVYTRGFLRKGVGICHGVGGSVFALLAAANAQPANAEEHLSRAVHLAQLATQYRSLTRRRLMTGPDRPWSLYEGLAGMCCAWAEVVGRVRRGGGVLPGVGCGMPGFDDVV